MPFLQKNIFFTKCTFKIPDKTHYYLHVSILYTTEEVRPVGLVQSSILSVEQRMEQYELREDRADVIVPAAQLFLMVAEVAKAENIIVPTVGLADGVINELATRV